MAKTVPSRPEMASSAPETGVPGPASGARVSFKPKVVQVVQSDTICSGDEAGGRGAGNISAKPCIQSPYSGASSDTSPGVTPRMLPSPTSSISSMLGSDFEAAEAQLELLLAEPHRTVFLEQEPGSSRWHSGDDSSALAEPSESPEFGFTIRNLDTGEVRNILGEDSPSSSFFGGTFNDPSDLPRAGVSCSAWEGWWQEQRHLNEQLWKAAHTGDAERVEALVSGFAADSCAGTWRSSVVTSSRRHCESSIVAWDVRVSPRASAASMDDALQSAHRPCIDSRSLYGRTALHIAAAGGHAEIVQTLINAGAELDCRTDAGFTAFHLACQRGSLESARALHAAGCDVSLQNHKGETALHLAAAKGHNDVLSFVLEISTSELLRVRNSYGQKPAEVCIDAGAVQLFEEWSRRAGGQDAGSRDDSYAGRTPCYGRNVVRRNSRADAVRRLLHRTGAQPEGLPNGAGYEALTERGSDGGVFGASSSGPSMRKHSSRSLEGRRRSKSFSTLRAEGIEVVGPDSFQLKSVLGKGSFGEVYQVVHKSTGQVYAMKVLRKNKIIGRHLVRYAMTERNLLSYIRHPFIVRLHFAFQTPGCLVLVLHYCPGGTLAKLIAEEGRLSEPLARLYTAEVLLAIEHLHERQVVYRDLKPENVVLDELNHAMLTDFGLSKAGVEGLAGTKSFCGSIAYLAPEILARVGHGPPVDLYGIGVLLFEALAGHPPFYSRDSEKLFRNIASAQLHPPAHASPQAASLIVALMQRDPAKRLGAKKTAEVRQHPFFEAPGFDFEKVLHREVPVPPRRMRRAGSKEAARSGGGSAGRKNGSSGGKVASPFEGRLEAQVRRRMPSSSSQDVPGWEFASPNMSYAASPTSSAVSPRQFRISPASSPRSQPMKPAVEEETATQKTAGAAAIRGVAAGPDKGAGALRVPAFFC